MRLGLILDHLGRLSLPLVVGVAAGYWLSDFGVRWLPTMLEGMALAIALALLLIVAGSWLRGKLLREEAGTLRWRRRTVICSALLLAAALGRLGVHSLQQPSPLTSLTPEELETTFAADRAYYAEIDQQLGLLLARLESSATLLDGDERPLGADDEALLRESWSSFRDLAIALDQVREYWEDWYRFDPSRAERWSHVESYLLTFAAELSLVEKSTRLTRLLDRNRNAVKLLDSPHPELGLPEHTYSRFRESFQGARDEGRVVAGEQYLRWLEETLLARDPALDAATAALRHRIAQHLATIDALDPLDRAARTVAGDLQGLKRLVRRTWYPTQRSVANWMGDTRLRRPGRYLITPAQLAEIDPELEPGDILLSRKYWYLSNLGLPGFWPHAILYLGTPDKLQRYFATPEVRAFVAQLSGREMELGELLAARHPVDWARYLGGDGDEPYRVTEAIGEGVVLNTFPAAAGDSLAALRPRLDRVAKAQAILEAFRHLGKPYDFDFDFATDHALVCTELVWRSYRPAAGKQGLGLTPIRIAGRLTLPANEVARQWIEDPVISQQLDFVLFLDADEAKQRSTRRDETAFRNSPQRSKWGGN